MDFSDIPTGADLAQDVSASSHHKGQVTTPISVTPIRQSKGPAPPIPHQQPSLRNDQVCEFSLQQHFNNGFKHICMVNLILQERHRAEAVSFGYGGALSLPTPQPAPRSSTSGNATTVSIGGVNNVNNTSDNNANNLTNNNASNVFTDNHGASSFHPFNTQERSVAFPTSVTTDPSSSSLLSEPVYEVGKKAILPSFECHM